MPKLTLLFSDIEIGAGNETDDFIDDELLSETIRSHFEESKKYPADLILNGDIIDFMKCPYHGKYPRHITEKVSIGKLESIHKAHPLFFQVLTDWLYESKSNRVIFVFGNHDFDLIFPGVQEKIKDIVAGNSKTYRERILFPGFEFTDNLVHVEHGSQLDRFFRVDPEKFVEFQPNKFVEEPFLMLPWGYNALYDNFIHIKEDYPILERLIPRLATLEALPWNLKKKLYVDSMLYMMKGFFYTQFKHWDDKLYRFHPRVFYAYLLTFLKQEFELKITTNARRKLKQNKFKVLSIGHNHSGALRETQQGNWILNTGNWRDEYKFLPLKRVFEAKSKSYGYVLHTPGQIIEITLIEVEAVQKNITMRKLKKILRGKIKVPF